MNPLKLLCTILALTTLLEAGLIVWLCRTGRYEYHTGGTYPLLYRCDKWTGQVSVLTLTDTSNYRFRWHTAPP